MDGRVLIDKYTSFQGTIKAEKVIVEGKVNGDISASRSILVRDGAVVDGNITTEKFFFEEGARHNGLILLGNEQPSKEAETVSQSLELEEDSPEVDQPEKQQPYHPNKEDKQEPKRLW